MRTLLVALLLAAPLTLAQAGRPTHEIVAPDGASASVDTHAAWEAYLVAQRHVQVKRLRAYARAGVFPRNDFQPGYAAQLLDADGHPCAMASLVIRSGQPDLIATLAATDNTLQFGDVTDGPLYEWILTSGLTREEAAFVQEPDFFVSPELPAQDQRQLLAEETERLRAHFLEAAARIEADEATSVAVALDRLGDRATIPPPRRL